MSLLAEPNLNNQRIALRIEYDGTNYSGWQKQSPPQISTVQQLLETALAKVADHEVKLSCAGRTDAGVHATGQVVHFECKKDRGEKAWIVGTNSLLPKSIRVASAVTVDDEFHARFSAFSRRYFYVIQESRTASAILAGKITTIRHPLNLEVMHRAAQSLVGEQDFTSFRAAGCQSKTPFRNVHRVRVFKSGAFIILDIEANAFLQHMVRNITGSLLEIGYGNQNEDWLTELLVVRDRSQAAVTAPPDGLYLVHVGYPPEYGLPATASVPLFLDLRE